MRVSADQRKSTFNNASIGRLTLKMRPSNRGPRFECKFCRITPIPMAIFPLGTLSQTTCAGLAGSSEHRDVGAPWVADMQNGNYQNPILHADYSDPDVVRVGQDFWMTASSFNHVPGLPILHSRDMVNWTLVNHALSALVPRAHFSSPRHGEGVWAPSLRNHAGRFWIFYPDPDFGIYSITAIDPRGKWTEPRLIKGGKGMIDPCPFWDDNGRAWLVHGWAKSRAGFCNRLTLQEMSPDGKSLLDLGRVIVDGDLMPGWRTIEGPKLYKRNGYYYIFAPAGGVTEGYQAVFRARNIEGPYENRIVLAQGSTPINGPHQGAWVDTPAGEHWFFHFQELPAYGRVVHLQPLQWRADDWPMIGADPDGDGTGEPVLVHPKPSMPPQPAETPATTDFFESKQLGLQWQWQGNFQPGWAELRVDGCSGLRLHAVHHSSEASFWSATNLLMQKFPAPSFHVEVTLDFVPVCSGERAGLVVFGYDYAWIGLRLVENGMFELVQTVCAHADQGGIEHVVAVDFIKGPVTFRVEVSDGAECRFFFRRAGGKLTSFGDKFMARSSKWVGAKVGLFAMAEANEHRSGFADFSSFIVGP